MKVKKRALLRNITPEWKIQLFLEPISPLDKIMTSLDNNFLTPFSKDAFINTDT